jgi:uncharacterized phage-associated protein
MSSAKSVVKELIRLSLGGPVPDPLTHYRLQCLVYYAQAWSLVLRDSELFPEEIKRLADGPVVPGLFDPQDAGQTCQLVKPAIFDNEPNLDDEDEALFLRYLWAAYAYLSPSGHFASIQVEAPFLQARKELENGGNGLIDTNGLAESFRRRPGWPAPLDEYFRLRKQREQEAGLAIETSPPLDIEAIWKGCRSLTPSANKQ